MSAGQPRLLIVTTPAGYFFSHRVELARRLISRGWEVHAALPAKQAPSFEGIALHRLDLPRGLASPLADLGALRRLAALIREVRPDLVHCFSPKAVVVGALAARLTGTPVALSVGGYFFDPEQPSPLDRMLCALIRAAPRALGKVDHLLLAGNEEESEAYWGGRPAARRRIVPGAGVDLERFRPTPRERAVPRIAFVGRLVRHKGFDLFAKAARRMREAGVAAEFVAAGRSAEGSRTALPKAELRALVEEGGIALETDVADVAGFLARADMVCLPSRGEGFSRALAEAAASGLPIVTADAPGCRSAVREGESGFLVPPGDLDALVAKLSLLARDAELRRAMGEASRRFAEAGLGEEAVSLRYERAYRELLAGAPAAAAVAPAGDPRPCNAARLD